MKLLNKEDRSEVIGNLSLGIVEAGKSKTYEFILQNDSSAKAIDIKVQCENAEIKIGESPSILKAGEEGVIILTWSPSITIREALETRLNISGFYLYESKHRV